MISVRLTVRFTVPLYISTSLGDLVKSVEPGLQHCGGSEDHHRASHAARHGKMGDFRIFHMGIKKVI